MGPSASTSETAPEGAVKDLILRNLHRAAERLVSSSQTLAATDCLCYFNVVVIVVVMLFLFFVFFFFAGDWGHTI